MVASFQRVAILGTGLMGGSLALALKQSRTPPRVAGFDISGQSRSGAGGLKTTGGLRAFDTISGNLAETIRGADLVVLATPVRAMELLFRDIAPLLAADTLVTDVGSTKAQVLAWAEASLPENASFVGGHPLAGKVAAGPWEAEGSLFQDAVYSICPLARTKRAAVDRLVKLVESIGATPYFVDANEHDGLVATVSQLPYLASVGVMNTAAGERSWREAATLAAGGFATISHLTENDPQMFTDICLTNREAIVRELDAFAQTMLDLRRMIAEGDESIKKVFDRAQEQHRIWLAGRAAESSERGPRVEPADLRPQNPFLGGRLGGLLRGRTRDK